jgi:hypothetical protein
MQQTGRREMKHQHAIPSICMQEPCSACMAQQEQEQKQEQEQEHKLNAHLSAVAAFLPLLRASDSLQLLLACSADHGASYAWEPRRTNKQRVWCQETVNSSGKLQEQQVEDGQQRIKLRYKHACLVEQLLKLPCSLG